MAVNLAVSIKDMALTSAFRAVNIHLQIPNQVGSTENLVQPALFSIASGGTISLATPVQFAVPSKGPEEPTVINRVYITTSSSGSPSSDSIVALINLEGDEIITFEENGVYIIEQISITIE